MPSQRLDEKGISVNTALPLAHSAATSNERRSDSYWRRLFLLTTFAFCALVGALRVGLWCPQASSRPHHGTPVVVPSCPVQPPPRAPSIEWRPELNDSWIEASAERLGAAVRIPTVSYDDMALDPTQDPRFAVLHDFHDHLRATYPLFHAVSTLTKVNTYGLVFEWKGSDESLKPALYAAHQDVVPVPPDTVERWKQPPFGGVYDKQAGLVWGRGASDDKNMLVALFEALEQLASEDFKPKRTVLVACGFDEEVGGKRGAQTIAQELAKRYPPPTAEGKGKPLEFILDEGGLGIGTTRQGRLDVAMPGVGEKGYADIKITVDAEGGHSSVPPDVTAIGMLAGLLVEIQRESNAFKPTLSPHNPVLTHLVCLADALDELERHPIAVGPSVGEGSGGAGFDLDRSLRKQLRNPKHWDEAAARIAEGTRAERYVLQTSQAIDVIAGGAKVNALPESASATVNYRISVDSNVAEVQDRMERLVMKRGKRLNLDFLGWRRDGASNNATLAAKEKNKAGSVYLTLLQSSEPTPMSSPHSPQFGVLASTIRYVFPGRLLPPSLEGGEEEEEVKRADRLVTPVIMTGNTDTRWYLALSDDIWRFHPNTFMMDSGKHAVNERMDVRSHARTARFLHALIRNADGPMQ